MEDTISDSVLHTTLLHHVSSTEMMTSERCVEAGDSRCDILYFHCCVIRTELTFLKLKPMLLTFFLISGYIYVRCYGAVRCLARRDPGFVPREDRNFKFLPGTGIRGDSEAEPPSLVSASKYNWI